MSRIVMPADGRIEARERCDAERNEFTDDELDLLGLEFVDVYLNDAVCWRGIPEAVLDFKISTFQVLGKWLSYRKQENSRPWHDRGRGPPVLEYFACA